MVRGVIGVYWSIFEYMLIQRVWSIFAELGREVFCEEQYAPFLNEMVIGGCPVHPVMKITEKDGENSVNTNHYDSTLFVKCFRIHQRRFSYIHKSDTQIAINKMKIISQSVAGTFYTKDAPMVNKAKEHPLYGELKYTLIMLRTIYDLNKKILGRFLFLIFFTA